MNHPSTNPTISFEDAKSRVLNMVSEMCSDESCAVLSSLDACVTDAVTSRWSNPVKTFIPLLAFREVEQCIKQGSCPANQEAASA